MKFHIRDWAGNILQYGLFNSFDDAEEYLTELLGEDYETDREEYYIEEVPS